jgi:PPK2 family polyphosphate:nucleotide phosphotransferase
MFEGISHPYLVPFDGSFQLRDAPTRPPSPLPAKKHCEAGLTRCIHKLDELQRRLYAQDQFAILLIFQAMDAAGKDGTIRAVMRGINPAGCQVFSFQQPSSNELDHDFLWRTACRLPERGRIGIFNRSYYEEVLIVRVHPEFLNNQKLPWIAPTLWEDRFESIRDHERHLARNGTVILKFWLNISKTEQRRRLYDRLKEPEKHWKFSEADLEERKLWPKYMDAYQAALNATSRPWAPWYAIPADHKPFMRLTVADILVKTLSKLHLSYPEITKAKRKLFVQFRRKLKGA